MGLTSSNAKGNNGGRSYDFLVEPVKMDCSFVVDAANANGLGIKNLKGAGVRNVFMHTSSTPGTNNGYLNPNPAVGFALIQLQNNYQKYAGGFSGLVAPLSGSNVAISGTALSIGNPYVITAPGVGSAGTQTIAPVADVSGSLASTWFSLYDSYGNTFIIWFSVAGVGKAPVGVSGTLVQQSISSGATAAQVGAALVVTINGLLAQQLLNPNAPAVASFTSSGTTTVTVVNVLSVPFPGGAADGVIPTGFTFAVTKDQTNTQNWQAVGLPKGIVPVNGAAFVATATGYSSRGGSTGQVQSPLVSGISAVEVIGDPNTTLFRQPMGGSAHSGGFMMIQFLAPTSSSVTTALASAPASGSGVSISFMMELSSVSIAGE